MAKPQHTCERCHGVIRGTARVPLVTAVTNHEASFPATPKVKK